MSRRSWKALSLWLAAVACLVVPARAEVVVSTLANTANKQTNFVYTGRWAGASFKTNNQAWTLTSATLAFAGASTTYGNLFVKVYNNSSTTNWPGSSLGTLSGSDNPASAGQYTYTSNGISLDPDTTYWLVAGVTPGGGFYNWYYDNANSNNSTGVWSIPSTRTYAGSYDGGSTWSGGDGYGYLFSIGATATAPSSVPEIDPATGGSALSLIAGALAMIEQRRRRRQAPTLAV